MIGVVVVAVAAATIVVGLGIFGALSFMQSLQNHFAVSKNAVLLIISDRTGGRKISPPVSPCSIAFLGGRGVSINQVQYTERLTIFGWSFGKADTT